MHNAVGSTDDPQAGELEKKELDANYDQCHWIGRGSGRRTTGDVRIASHPGYRHLVDRVRDCRGKQPRGVLRDHPGPEFRGKRLLAGFVIGHVLGL